MPTVFTWKTGSAYEIFNEKTHLNSTTQCKFYLSKNLQKTYINRRGTEIFILLGHSLK